MRRYLFIVAREQPDLCEYLRRDLSGDREVQVLLDRREGERRQQVQAHELERRRGHRRRQPGIGANLPAIGFGASLPVLVVEDRAGSPLSESIMSSRGIHG